MSERNALEVFAEENPDWIQRWMLCQKEFDNGNPLPLTMLQLETKIEAELEKQNDKQKTSIRKHLTRTT